MGIIANLARSAVIIKSPNEPVSISRVANAFRCTMHSFDISFAFTFDSDPRRGLGGSPSQKEHWKIGIVQNVVFDMMTFKYDDGRIFKAEFKDAVVDSSATMFRPFYHDPVNVETCKIDPALKCGTWLPIMEPVADVWYTSKGYGELLDAWDASGVANDNKPDILNMWDEPSFGAKLRLDNRALISRAERVLALQTWLVAKTPKETEALAHIPAFSLVFWMETVPGPEDLFVYAPAYRYGFYAQTGIAKSVKAGGGAARPRPASGKGGRWPIMVGGTAVERGRKWLADNGLTP